jgi:transcriptional regulator with XRE-family HTH domain
LTAFQHFLYSEDMTHCLVEYRNSCSPALTQEELGERLGKKLRKKRVVPGNTIARWERGECLPQKEYRAAISELIGVPIDRIVADCLAKPEAVG